MDLNILERTIYWDGRYSLVCVFHLWPAFIKVVCVEFVYCWSLFLFLIVSPCCTSKGKTDILLCFCSA